MSLRRTHLTRLAPLLCACAFLIAQLGSFVHELSAHHGRCPDDGDLVDLPVAQAPSSLHTFASLPTIDDGRSGDGADHGDHCILTAASHATPPATCHVSALIAGPALPALAARTPDAPRGAGDLYLTAPKTSPPV